MQTRAVIPPCGLARGRRSRALRRSSSSSGRSSSTLLRLLLRLRLLGGAARLALHPPGLVEEAQHAIGRQRALRHPGFHLVEVELETILVVLCEQRIEVAE